MFVWKELLIYCFQSKDSFCISFNKIGVVCITGHCKTTALTCHLIASIFVHWLMAFSHSRLLKKSIFFLNRSKTEISIVLYISN